MFDMTIIGRDTSRKNWKIIHQIMRRLGDRGSTQDESRLAERVIIEGIIASYVQGGMVGLVQSGMDCDCSQYVNSDLVPNLTAIQFQIRRDDMVEWADGPCQLSITSPDELPRAYSRDLAMEAWEDGHPHIVSTAQRLA